MIVILRKQYVNFESDEYEFIGQVSLETVKEHLKSYPWKEQLKLHFDLVEEHAFPSIHLEKANRELIINGADNGKFSIQYNYRSFLKKTARSFPYDLNEVELLIEKFVSLEPNQFKIELQKKSFIENSFLMNLLMSIGSDEKKLRENTSYNTEYKYYIKPSRVISKLLMSIVFLLMPSVLLLFTNSKIDFQAFIFLQILLSLFALPGLIITVNHLAYNGKLTLHFKRTENKFIVGNGSKNWVFDKKNISKMVRYEPNSNNSPWNGYEFTVLKFDNDAELWLSNILIKTADLDKHLGNIEKDYRKSWIPLLKKTVANNL